MFFKRRAQLFPGKSERRLKKYIGNQKTVWCIFCQNTQQLQSRINLIREMHIPNQPSQQINYYVQYQPMPTHLSQAHSNVHIYHRAEPSNNMNKMNTEMDANKSRGSIYQYQNEQISFRKDLGKNSNYNTESSVGKYATIDYTNPELNQPYGNRQYLSSPYDNIQRNKSLFQVKRKESNNNSINSREIREQYYKNPQSEELLNKLPQLQFQHIHKVNTSRPYYASPTSDLKLKQQKKASSPFNLHTRSSSFKQSNLQGVQTKKVDQEETEEVKKMKETLKFNSPSKNNYQSKTMETNKWVNPYSERNLENTLKKQYTPQTSNSTSTTFDTPSKPISVSYKQNYQNGYYQKDQKNENCNNVHQSGQIEELKKQIIRYMQLNKKLEENLDQQKILSHQKEVKIKNLQVEITTHKINFEKKLQSIQRDFILKKEGALTLAKQDYEKQLSKLNTQLNEKSTKQAKEIENKYQSCLDELKVQLQKQKKKFALTAQDQQKRITEHQLKNTQIESTKKNLESKISQLQEQLKKKSLQIVTLIGKNQQMKQKLQTKSTQNQQNKPKDLPIDQIQKIKALEQKNSIYLINIDKISQKHKDTRNELEKMHRKGEQLNGILCEKDNVIRNMGRDLRNKDKFISELKKSNEAFEKIIKLSNENLVKLSLKALNQKYRQ